MGALWVMTTVVVPSSRFTCSIACSTMMPVAQSSAPVGSSHSSTAGRLAMARAIATRCCSPPESCDTKCFRRSASPTRASASAGSIGSSASSVTSATFSSAVRLGMRL